MTASILSESTFTKEVTDYSLVKEEKLVRFSLNGTECIIGDPDENFPSYVSDEKKIFLNISGSQYHLLYDTLGVIFHLFEQDPDTLFVLDTEENFSNKMIELPTKFIFVLLDYYKVRYVLESSKRNAMVNANNFYLRQTRNISHKPALAFFKYMSPFIKNKTIEPYRKVYVSRKIVNKEKVSVFGHTWPVVQVSDKMFNRIDDEDILENFFRTHGFEIIYPENFESFQEQINFFYEVKTIISISGAGLSNAMFMQDHGNVVELLTSHFIWRNQDNNTPNVRILREEEHYFYNSMAFERNHDYIAVNNKEKSAQDVIDRFLSNPILKAILV